MHGLISMFAVCTTLLRAYKELLVATRSLTYRSLELKLHAVNSPSKEYVSRPRWFDSYKRPLNLCIFAGLLRSQMS